MDIIWRVLLRSIIVVTVAELEDGGDTRILGTSSDFSKFSDGVVLCACALKSTIEEQGDRH